MIIDLEPITKEIVGMAVPIPTSGTLSGHAAGEPFDKLVYSLIKKVHPEHTYRQFEFLNKLYTDGGSAVSRDERLMLIKHPSLRFLLNRGSAPTLKWTPETPFEEKQDDTADILIASDDYFQLIDVKTVNTKKSAQPPNIISASKLAEMCKLMLDNNEFDTHDIFYFEVRWEKQDNQLVCVSSTYRNIFKTDPSKLYINWAAATQIQFHVSDLSQDYRGTKQEWCQDFLKSFVHRAQLRIDRMEEKFIRRYSDLV